jgi:hypothetical protein
VDIAICKSHAAVTATTAEADSRNKTHERLSIKMTLSPTCLSRSLACLYSLQQPSQANGVPVNMVVTVESRHGEHPPPVDREVVMVYQGKTRDKVTSWVAAQGDHAQLELFILLDDSSGPSLGTQLDDIRQFINAQPATTKVGVAYMQNGTAQVVQNLTDEHALAAKSPASLRGVAGVNASPYFALSDLVKRWPASSRRREVVMVSDGIDRYYDMEDQQDPYVIDAISDAQRARVVVHTIYNPGVGHFGHSYWRNYWGQLYLARVADETGGQSYYMGFTSPAVAFAPFLDDVDHRLTNQYLLTFDAMSGKKGGLQPLKITTELRAVSLAAADKVYVPLGPQ